MKDSENKNLNEGLPLGGEGSAFKEYEVPSDVGNAPLTDEKTAQVSLDPNRPPKDEKKNKNIAFIAIMCVLGGILLFSLIYGLAKGNLKDVMSTVGSIALAILILLVMITVHEFGHYVAGKLLGFGITEFSIGFGPAIIKKKKKNGEYFSIRALPLGGFCAFEGEDDDSTSPTAFNNRAPWKRIIVLVAGATMNFLLALVLIVMLFGIYGQSLLASFEIMPSTEYSQEYSLSAGDVITEIDGTSIYMQTDLISALKGKKQGDVVDVEVYRTDASGKKYKEDIKVTLRSDVNSKNSTDIGSVSRALGIATLAYIEEVDEENPYGFKAGDAIFRECTSDYEHSSADQNDKYLQEARIYNEEDLAEYLSGKKKGDEVMLWLFRGEDYYRLTITLKEDFPTEGVNAYEFLGIQEVSYQDRWATDTVRLGFFRTIGGTFVYAFKIAGTIFTVLGELLTGALGLNAMGGTVTTVVMTSQVIKLGGFKFFLEIAAYIGVNLAVFNLLPIPALDGSRVVFTLIEMIFRKPVPKKIEGIIHTVGLIVLFGFAILVDVLQLF